MYVDFSSIKFERMQIEKFCLNNFLSKMLLFCHQHHYSYNHIIIQFQNRLHHLLFWYGHRNMVVIGTLAKRWTEPQNYKQFLVLFAFVFLYMLCIS